MPGHKDEGREKLCSVLIKLLAPAARVCLGAVAQLTDHTTDFECWETLQSGIQEGWKTVFVKSGSREPLFAEHQRRAQRTSSSSPQELQHLVNVLTWELGPQATLLLRAQMSKFTFSPQPWPFLGSFKPCLCKSCKPSPYHRHILRHENHGMCVMGRSDHNLEGCWYVGRDLCSAFCVDLTLQMLRHRVTVFLLHMTNTGQSHLINDTHTHAHKDSDSEGLIPPD